MIRLSLLTLAALSAFSANSILCRMALADGGMDAFSFSLIRLFSGAVMLSVLVFISGNAPKAWLSTGAWRSSGNWRSASALTVYVVAFSLAYLSLPAASGALILFAAVQATMLVGAVRGGENPGARQWGGIALAMGGLVYLLLPGLDAPSPTGALLMLFSGIAWGIYSLRGIGKSQPLLATSGNFVRATVLALPVCLAALPLIHVTPSGMLLAAISGALASGIGYAIWYAALRSLNPLHASAAQLAVPLLTAVAGVAFLAEPLTARLALASLLILGGIALTLTRHADSTVTG
ncbi:MAG: DMT family transporter [Mariprofundaceae bacterium]|nr:DMT family transporter [Mariprofundaceae bacterium]